MTTKEIGAGERRGEYRLAGYDVPSRGWYEIDGAFVTLGEAERVAMEMLEEAGHTGHHEGGSSGSDHIYVVHPEGGTIRVFSKTLGLSSMMRRDSAERDARKRLRQYLLISPRA